MGLGKIGSRLAKLAKAFDMRVLATKRNPAAAAGAADGVHPPEALAALLPQADFVALTCPLTAATEKLIDAAAFASMKESAYLINVARGGCVDEPALLAAVQSGAIAGAGNRIISGKNLCRRIRPSGTSKNVLITPHTARRNAHVRRKSDRHSAGESELPVARRDGTPQPGRVVVQQAGLAKGAEV